MIEFSYVFAFLLAVHLIFTREAETEDGTKMYFSFGGGGKKTSQSEIIAAQEAAAKKERERLATETAQKEATAQSQAQSAFATAESKRKALVSNVIETDEEARRKYLKAV